jgi:hypothetical protein
MKSRKTAKNAPKMQFEGAQSEDGAAVAAGCRRFFFYYVYS